MINEFKKEHNITVVTYITESGLSGGYFIALAGDYIVASPTSLVGSVGAIITVTNYAELLRKLGIKVNVIKSGKYKDIASPFKELSLKEKAILKRVVQVVYNVFVNVVIEKRGGKLCKANLTDILNAGIYCGQDALTVGLVDEISSLKEAIERARELSGLSPTAPVKEVKEEKPFLVLDCQ